MISKSFKKQRGSIAKWLARLLLLDIVCAMKESQNLSWKDALGALQERNIRYVSDLRKSDLQDAARRSELVGGQAPFAIIVSCADSRVVPELVFDSGLGELFVIRVAGNVANTSSIASVEYAVAHLGVQLIVVMGHESCGAVKAALGGGDNGPNLNHLLSHIQPVIDSAKSSEVDDVVRQNARTAANAYLENSAILQDAKNKGALHIASAYYELSSGKVEFLD